MIVSRAAERQHAAALPETRQRLAGCMAERDRFITRLPHDRREKR